MKKIVTLLGIIGLATTTFSQSKFAVGIQAGSITSHTDATPNKTNFTYGLNAQANFTKYLKAKLEIGAGKLEGGNNNGQIMYYTSDIYQGSINLQVYPMGIFNKVNTETYWFYLSKIYGLVGLGAIRSNTTIDPLPQLNLFNYKGDYSGVDMIVPVGFGIDIPFSKPFEDKGLHLNLFYKTVYIQSDKVDGYDPNIDINTSNDAYTNFGIGFQYHF